MKKLFKLAAVTAALTMFASAAAEAQGGRGRGGRGNSANALTAEGVSADSAYTVMLAGITLDATKKAAVLALITKYQTDMRANPAPARGGRRGGGGGGGGGAAGGGGAVVAADSAAQAAAMAAFTKRNEFTNTFRTEVKKHLDTAQSTTFDTTFPAPGAGRRGGGGGIPAAA